MKQKHSLTYNFLMNSILKASGFLFPLLSFPYVTRVLGAEGLGQVSFASAFVGYFSMAAMLGIPTYGIRVCAQCRDDKERLSRTVQELLLISLGTTVLAYILLFFLLAGIPALRERRSVILVSSAAILLTTIGVEWFYQAMEEYGYIAWRNMAGKSLALLLLFCLVKKREDTFFYAGITVVGTSGSNLINFLRLRSYVTWKKTGKYQWKRHIRPMLTFFLFSVTTTVYTGLDSMMLGILSDDRQTGYYAAAVKLKNVLVSMITALGTVLLPRASYYVEKGQMGKFYATFRKASRFVMLLAGPLTIYFMVEARDTIGFLAGREFLEAAPAMVIIMPTLLLIGFSQLIGMQLFIPLGREKDTVSSTFAGAVTDLVLNGLLIPGWGAAGAAMGTLMAEGVVLLVQLILLCKRQEGKHLLEKREKGSLKTPVISLFSASMILALWKMFCAQENAYFLNLLFSSLLFFGTYGMILFIRKEPLIMVFLGQLKKEKK